MAKRKAKEPIVAFGYRLDSRGGVIRETVDVERPGDYGCDPLGDGTFRMVPSGDIVTREEMEHRLRPKV